MQTRTKILIASIGGALALGMTGGAVAGKYKDGDHRGPMSAIMAMVDSDGDGKITRAEADAFRDSQMAKFDTDGDGSLNADEYIAMREDFRRQMMQARFKSQDENGDGKLSKEELGDRVDRMFEWMDRNDDGVIEGDEMRPHRGRDHKD